MGINLISVLDVIQDNLPDYGECDNKQKTILGCLRQLNYVALRLDKPTNHKINDLLERAQGLEPIAEGSMLLKEDRP